jgi:folate-dependent phosphoribosylglycinamide formyltransferase PurN
MLRIGWFSTGRGEGSRGLLRFVHDRLQSEDVDACIDFVFSNRAPGEAEGSDEYFRLVREFGLPLITHSSTEFRRRGGGRLADRRAEFDAEVLELLAGRRPDICVLAGYMLIASSGLCRTFPLLNLHPALPDGPIGTWQEVVWQLIEQRAARTGAMTHLATEEVDRGPLVSYVTVPLDTPQLEPHWQELGEREAANIRAERGEEYELFRLIRAEQYSREPFLLLETLRSLSRGEIGLDVSMPGNEVTVANSESCDPESYGGLCLNSRIEEEMGRG